MKKNKIHAHVNRIMMVLLPAIILLMIMLGWWLGLFTEIEEEQIRMRLPTDCGRRIAAGQ